MSAVQTLLYSFFSCLFGGKVNFCRSFQIFGIGAAVIYIQKNSFAP